MEFLVLVASMLPMLVATPRRFPPRPPPEPPGPPPWHRPAEPPPEPEPPEPPQPQPEPPSEAPGPRNAYAMDPYDAWRREGRGRVYSREGGRVGLNFKVIALFVDVTICVGKDLKHRSISCFHLFPISSNPRLDF